jgi:hypothetical protein
LQRDVYFSVIEFLLTIVFFMVCWSGTPEVLLANMALNIIAKFFADIAAWPCTLVDGLNMLSL